MFQLETTQLYAKVCWGCRLYFFARLVNEQHYLSLSINTVMKMLKTGATVTSITTNYKDIIQKFLGSCDAFSFMSSVKGTLSYWKQFLYDVLAMVKQLGIPTFFLRLSCADLNPIHDGVGKKVPLPVFPL